MRGCLLEFITKNNHWVNENSYEETYFWLNGGKYSSTKKLIVLIIIMCNLLPDLAPHSPESRITSIINVKLSEVTYFLQFNTNLNYYRLHAQSSIIVLQ